MNISQEGISLIKKFENDGGQNPIDAAKLGCKIYHGPYVYNFKEIYNILNKINILLKTNSVRSVVNILIKETNLPKKLIYNEVLKVKDKK